jgi:hypothetical protein
MHTCGRCGCHVASYLRVGAGFGSDFVKLCSSCGWVHPDTRVHRQAAAQEELSSWTAEISEAIRQVKGMAPGDSPERLRAPHRQYGAASDRIPLCPSEKRNSAYRMSSSGGATMESEKKGPEMRTRSGRFQVTIWKRDRTIPPRSAFGAERQVVAVRACVQYSRWNRITREWENQSIWCGVHELRDLVQALDALNETGVLDKEVSLGELKAQADCVA